LNYHFENDMIVLEKWDPMKPISAIYFEGEKERYYVKRFMIDYPDKEERFISEHSKTQLEIVATDYRPVAEIVFSKRSLQNTTVDFEEFIAVKGIKAIGNQLTTDKIKQVNLLEPHPYEPPVLDAIEVEEDHLDATNTSQPKLF
jgi:topoisomerase-4 subunit A